MPAPAAPVILSPADGSAFLDPRSLLLVVLDEYASGVTPTAVEIVQGAVVVQDASGTAGLPTWDGEAFLVASDGSAGQMATATSVGALNKINFRDPDPGSPSTFGNGSIDDREVIDLSLSYYVSYTGAVHDGAAVLLHIEHGDEHGTEHHAPNIPNSSSGALRTTSANPNYTVAQEIARILGRNKITVGELRELMNQPDPNLPNDRAMAYLRVSVRPYTFSGYTVTDWRVGGIQMGVKYNSGASDRQGSSRLEVYSDVGLTSLVYTTEIAGESLIHTVPSGTLAGGTTYYLRANRSNDQGVTETSSWSATATITTMADGTSRIIHSASEDRQIVYTIGWGEWVDGAMARRRTASPTTNAVYVTTLDRAKLPSRNWWVAGFEEHGYDVAYIEVFSLADCDATEGSFYYDEVGVEGEENALYFHCLGSVSPRGTITDDLGVVAILSHPYSETPVACGPGNRYTASPLVKSHPGVTLDIKDQAQQLYAVPDGSLVLGNDDVPGTDICRFDTFLAVPDRVGNVTSGLLGYRRPVEIAAVIPGVPWEDRLLLAQGLASVDPKAVSAEAMTVSVAGRQALDEAERYTSDGGNEDGTTAPEGIGNARGLEAVLVGSNEYRVGLNVGGISAWFRAGVPAATGSFSFDSARHIVTDFEPEARRTYNASLSQGTSTKSPPLMAVAALLRAGYRSDQILQATFQAIHDSLPPEINANSNCIVKDEVNGLELLGVLETTGAFHVCRRADGSVLARPFKPAGPDAYTVVLGPSDLRSDPISGVDFSMLGYWFEVAWTNAAGDAKTAPFSATGTPAQAKVRGKVQVPTVCGSYEATIWVIVNAVQTSERRIVEVDAAPKAALAFPGGTVLLWGKGPSVDGLYEADFFKVLKAVPKLEQAAETISLTLEHVRRLTTSERPF